MIWFSVNLYIITNKKIGVGWDSSSIRERLHVITLPGKREVFLDDELIVVLDDAKIIRSPEMITISTTIQF